MKLSEAEQLVDTILSEQGHDEILIDNYFIFHKYLGKQEYIPYNMTVLDKNFPITLQAALGEDVYCMLVGLYGDYGITMCSGWIENKARFIELIEHMIIWSQWGVYHNFPERKVSYLDGHKEPLAEEPVYVYLKRDINNFTQHFDSLDIPATIPTISNMIQFIEDNPKRIVDKILGGGEE